MFKRYFYDNAFKFKVIFTGFCRVHLNDSGRDDDINFDIKQISFGLINLDGFKIKFRIKLVRT